MWLWPGGLSWASRRGPGSHCSPSGGPRWHSLLPVLQEGHGPEGHEDTEEHSSWVVRGSSAVRRGERAQGRASIQTQVGSKIPTCYFFPFPWLTLAMGQIPEIFRMAQVSQSGTPTGTDLLSMSRGCLSWAYPQPGRQPGPSSPSPNPPAATHTGVLVPTVTRPEIKSRVPTRVTGSRQAM